MSATTRIELKKLLGYILSTYGCMHPYRLSRILVLVNWKALEEKGEPITSFTVEGFEAGFAIPEIASLKEENDPCFRPNKERRCMEYVCATPSLPEDVRKIVDEVMAEVKNLDDINLNKKVVHDERYKELLARGGFP